MLDTVRMKITLREETGEVYEQEIIEDIYTNIKKMENCTEVNFKNEDIREIILTFSFPKYYSKTNAYLIKTREECIKAQICFNTKILASLDSKASKYGLKLIDWLREHITVKIIRVDTPFTYLKEESEEFNSYRNIFQFLALVYNKVNKKSGIKSIHTYLDETIETLTLADNPNVNSANKKVSIYNQNKKIKDCYGKKGNEFLENIEKEFPDLKNRIRIEASKRINRKEMNFIEFLGFDIYKEYVNEFLEYILENTLDKKMLEIVKEESIKKLAQELSIERSKNGFRIKDFILKHKEKILSFDVLRKAIMKTSLNENSGYTLVKKAKKRIEELEKEKGIIYMDVEKKIQNIRERILEYQEDYKKDTEADKISKQNYEVETKRTRSKLFKNF